MTRVCSTHSVIDFICSEFHIRKSSQVFDPLCSLEFYEYQRLDQYAKNYFYMIQREAQAFSTCRGVSSVLGRKVAKLQDWDCSALLMKCAENLVSCCVSLLFNIAIPPSLYNFSTHCDATKSNDVIPFKLVNNPRSCMLRVVHI